MPSYLRALRERGWRSTSCWVIYPPAFLVCGRNADIRQVSGPPRGATRLRFPFLTPVSTKVWAQLSRGNNLAVSGFGHYDYSGSSFFLARFGAVRSYIDLLPRCGSVHLTDIYYCSVVLTYVSLCARVVRGYLSSRAGTGNVYCPGLLRQKGERCLQLVCRFGRSNVLLRWVAGGM